MNPGGGQRKPGMLSGFVDCAVCEKHVVPAEARRCEYCDLSVHRSSAAHILMRGPCGKTVRLEDPRSVFICNDCMHDDT